MAKDRSIQVRLDMLDRQRLNEIAANFCTTAAGAVRMLIKREYDRTHGALSRARTGLFIRECDRCHEQVPCKVFPTLLSVTLAHLPLNGPHHSPDCPRWREEPA
jgi:hypothetical protein